MDEKNAIIDYEKLFNTDKKKADAFDRIAEKYYFNNFGTFSKSEIDLLMFDIYLEQSIINNKLNTNLVNYNAVSDYKMARNLGITPQRIRNLKIKKQYVYPVGVVLPEYEAHQEYDSAPPSVCSLYFFRRKAWNPVGAAEAADYCVQYLPVSE